MVPAVSSHFCQDFHCLSTHSEMSAELRVRVHWHCYVKIFIYSRYGLFLEVTHELPNFYDIVKEQYMKPGHKFILHVWDMLNQNLH